jgi:hypothetical protein
MEKSSEIPEQMHLKKVLRRNAATIWLKIVQRRIAFCREPGWYIILHYVYILFFQNPVLKISCLPISKKVPTFLKKGPDLSQKRSASFSKEEF